MRRGLVTAACAVSLLSCQPAWSVDGILFGASHVSVTGGALVGDTPVRDATITFRCPAGSDVKTMTTGVNGEGQFFFRGEGTHFPTACQLEIAAPGFDAFAEDFTTLCTDNARPDPSCRRARVAIVLHAKGAPVASSTPTATATATTTATTTATPTTTATATATRIPRQKDPGSSF